MIGNGLIMSTLAYIIPVYGCCSEYLLNTLQVQQNIACRHITKLPLMTPTKTLLTQCGWLSVRQMVQYFTIIQLHKILNEKKPRYIYEKVAPVRPMRNTRNTDYLTLELKTCKTSTATKSFIHRSISQWNNLPLAIREIRDKRLFKMRLKDYIKKTLPVK